MTEFIERRRFEGKQIRNKQRSFEDFELRECEFAHCTLDDTRSSDRRPLVRHGRLLQCEVDHCRVGGAVLEDLVIDGLRTNGLFRVTASVFKHVTLRGPIGDLLIHPSVWPGPILDADQQRFDAANESYYAQVDWALDITEADFESAEIQGVPSRLVRRDHRSQAVITLEAAQRGRWRELDLTDTYWPGMIELLLEDQVPEKLLIAPRRHRDFSRLIAGLNRLQDAGVVF